MLPLSINSICPDAKLAQDIYGPTGKPLLHSGVTLTRDYIDQLRTRGVRQLWIGDADTDDISDPSPLSPQLRASLSARLGESFDRMKSAASGELRDAYAGVVRKEMESARFAERVRAVVGDAGLGQLGGDINQMLDELKGKRVVAGLNSLKSHDAYTFQHSIDVTVTGVILASSLGWPRWRLREFAIGCLLHDIGKLFIDPTILNKTSGLMPDEVAQFRAHPLVGYAVVKNLASSTGLLAAHVAYQHHERQDGQGYPRRLRGDNLLGRNERNTIHDFGALAAVADVYDALTSARAYRAAWSPARAMAMIAEQSGTHFNREVVAIMQRSIAPFPVLSRVVVTTGAYAGWRGVVSAVTPRALSRPRVRLFTRPDGTRIDAIEVDLREHEDAQLQDDVTLDDVSVRRAAA